MNTNPLFNNDPILNFVFNKLDLGVGFVLIISIIVVLILFSLTFKDNTWFDEDIVVPDKYKHDRNGHGFIRSNNLYLVFLPILNFMIFSYYEKIHSYTTILVQSGINFSLPNDVVFESIFQPFSEYYSYIPVISAFLIGLTTFFVFIFRQGKIKVSNKEYFNRTDWLFKDGKPRLVCIIFSFTVHFLQLTITLGWVSRHLFISFLVYRKLFISQELQAILPPLHPDGMFGLSALEEIAKSTSLVFALIGLVVSSWLIGSVSTMGGWRNAVFSNLGIPLAVLGFVIIAPLGVTIILEPAHDLMVDTKIEYSSYIGQRISSNNHQTQNLLKGNLDKSNLEDSWEKEKIISEIYAKVIEVPDWPIKFQGMVTVIFNMFLPAIIAVMIDFTKTRLTIVEKKE